MADKPKLKVLEFKRPEPDTDKDEVISQIRDSKFDGILVIMEKGNGDFDMVTNQGDAGGTLLFLERFKNHVIAQYQRVNTIMKEPS